MKKSIALIVLIGINQIINGQHNYDSQNTIYSKESNVGIGINNPSAKLQVNGDISSINKIGFYTHDAFSVSSNSVAHYGLSKISGTGYHHVGLSGYFGLNFYTQGKERIKVNLDGNVGIGTTNPTYRLEVHGVLAIKNGNTDLLLYRDNDVGDWSLLRTNTGNGLALIGRPDDVALSVSRTTSNVGIGTITPDEKLHVNGTATITANIGNVTGPHWQTGKHTLELQNSDAGDVVLSFHRAGYTSAAIKHPSFGGLAFSATGGYNQTHMYLKANGYVGIGTTTPDAKLTVKGKIHAEEVKIDLSVPAPDYVFKKEYDLLTIEEVQQHIQEKGHLPNIPSAKVMETEGVDLGVMNMKLLEKIEELTLYTIQQQKQINNQQEINKALENRLKKLEKLVIKE